MKLAEALALRSDLQKKLAQLNHEIREAARYQEGSEPAENAAGLLDQAHGIVGDLERLIRAVNRTNTATVLPDSGGMTLTDAIARRDALGQHRALCADAAGAASNRGGFSFRHLRSELRTMTDLPVAELRHQADDYARQRRELDVQIQQANWATGLLEADG